MAKNQSYYFSHDINASNDPKIAAMISELGMISYAWWWILIEKLAAADDYKLPLKKYTFVALDNELRMNNEQISTSVQQVFNKNQHVLEQNSMCSFCSFLLIYLLIHDYELLDCDDEYFWSPSLIRRFEFKKVKEETIREKRRLAGLKSAESRKAKKQNLTHVQQNLTHVQQNQLIKEKKRKENNIERDTRARENENPLSMFDDDEVKNKPIYELYVKSIGVVSPALNVTAAIEALREKTNKLTGKRNMKEYTVKNEFFYPIYDKPVVIQTNVNTTYAAVGIPKRYYDMDFDWLRKHGSFPKENAEAYAVVKEYSHNLKENLESGKGLILRGPAGTGKTSIAVSLLKEAMRLGKGCLMISMPNLLDNMLTLSKGDNVAYLSYEQKLRNIPLLLLDDFGAEYSKSDWVVSKVESVIIDRYNRMKPIILTTNYSETWTEKNYSQRVYDRLRGEYAVAIFNGESHR